MSTKPQTKQQVFNKVAKHLLKQNERATNADGGCMYRGEAGTKCAVGCLIPDKKYTEELDYPEMGSSNLARSRAVQEVLEGEGLQLFENGKPTEMMDMLNRLQSVHDNTAPSAWEFHLKRCAKELGLKFNA